MTRLVNSEESIQEIADGLYLSRRTCQRHIAAIYEKAGVKSRMGLYQLYIKNSAGHDSQKGIRMKRIKITVLLILLCVLAGVPQKTHRFGPIAPKASRNFWISR